MNRDTIPTGTIGATALNTSAWEPTDDLRARIAIAHGKASTPGYDIWIDPEQVDVEAWNHVGDPLAESLINELRERKLMGGDHYANARRLQAEGVRAAVDFFADVEHVPDWVDFAAMRSGAAMGRRNPVGLMMGFHGSLLATYFDPATAHVMASTARLTREGADFRRRFWETATGFIGALDVDGMMVGGPQWERWVRIRMLHTMIRLGIHRSGRWDYTMGIPISQVATAAFTPLGGLLRVLIIQEFGGIVSPEESDSFTLMWRWISRIEGANVELLGTTHAEQLRISERIHQYLYAPDDASREVSANLLDGLASMKIFPMSRGVHAAVMRRLLREELMFTVPGKDAATDLALPIPSRAEELALSATIAGLTIVNQAMRIGPVRWLAERHGMKLVDFATQRGLDHRPADYKASPVVGDRG